MAGVVTSFDNPGSMNQSSTTLPFTAAPTMTNRTNTELNLCVLRRYLPSIRGINLVIANAVVYTFSVEANSWEKTGIEGTLFVCEQTADNFVSSAAHSRAMCRKRACVFVLNRRGLDNVIVELGRVAECDFADDLLNLRLEDQSDGPPMILGIWMYAESPSVRRSYGEFVVDFWTRIRREHSTPAPYAADSQDFAGPAMQVMRKRLSLTDLFKQGDTCGN